MVKRLKMQVSSDESNNQRGYTAFGKEAAKGSSIGDFKEYYSIGRNFTTKQAQELNCWVNIWPEFMDFERSCEKIFFPI